IRLPIASRQPAGYARRGPRRGPSGRGPWSHRGRAMRRSLPFAVVGLMLLAGLAAGPGPDERSRPTLDRGAVVRGPRHQRRLALVFTADRFAEGAESILDSLRARRVRASFFLTGRFLRAGP